MVTWLGNLTCPAKGPTMVCSKIRSHRTMKDCWKVLVADQKACYPEMLTTINAIAKSVWAVWLLANGKAWPWLLLCWPGFSACVLRGIVEAFFNLCPIFFISPRLHGSPRALRQVLVIVLKGVLGDLQQILSFGSCPPEHSMERVRMTDIEFGCQRFCHIRRKNLCRLN